MQPFPPTWQFTPFFLAVSKSSFSTLMNRNGGEDQKKELTSMFIGTTISFILHGVTCFQVIWYFRFQSGRSSKCMKCLILFIWLGETLSCVFMVCTTLHAFLGPAIARAKVGRDSCRYWGAPAQKMASDVCTFSVEGFFIMRMWRFSGKKKLIALAFIPYIVGNVIGFIILIQNIRLPCSPKFSQSTSVLVFMNFGFKLFADSVTVLTMCYMLHVRSLGITRHTNTIKIVRALILWIISTGMLTWLNTVLILACYIGVGNLPNPSGIYYIRAGLYANAMFAQLNTRIRFRAMAGEAIPYSINLDTMSSGQRVNFDSQPANGSVLNPPS